MHDPDIAAMLFPSETPQQAPEWFKAQQEAAEARLLGSQKAQQGQPEAASSMFSEKPAPEPVADTGDVAAKLFDTDAGHFDDSAVAGFFDGFAGTAIAGGDTERAQALTAAKDAMIADFRTAGTDASVVKEALDIVRERQGDTVFGAVSEDRLAADQAQAMALLADEGVTDSDLNAARTFIRDLETVSPGTIRSLEATGAGNDPRLIRKAIAEARRRGY